MPWVGGGISDWFSLDFRNPILLTKLEMNGGDVNVYGNGTLVKCFVTRFWLYYKNKTAGQWYKYYPVGNQNATVQWGCAGYRFSGCRIEPDSSLLDTRRKSSPDTG